MQFKKIKKRRNDFVKDVADKSTKSCMMILKHFLKEESKDKGFLGFRKGQKISSV